ncbi:MAG: hypothetical protein IPP03_22920 [Dechloromonas sp.]|nr:hypothetical protein [Candidatus Dechloromonas phosphoritropha]
MLVDALFIKSRQEDRVVSRAVLTVSGTASAPMASGHSRACGSGDA